MIFATLCTQGFPVAGNAVRSLIFDSVRGKLERERHLA
jgi:hypothetical protein